jgi:hypothetical protein
VRVQQKKSGSSFKSRFKVLKDHHPVKPDKMEESDKMKKQIFSELISKKHFLSQSERYQRAIKIVSPMQLFQLFLRYIAVNLLKSLIK